MTCGVAVATSQFCHGAVGAKHARHLDAVFVSASCSDGVGKTSAYVGEQLGSFRHEKRHRVSERVYGIVFVSADSHQRTSQIVGVAHTSYWFYADAFGCGEVSAICVVEDIA